MTGNGWNQENPRTKAAQWVCAMFSSTLLLFSMPLALAVVIVLF
jgi:hypothetical protein